MIRIRTVRSGQALLMEDNTRPCIRETQGKEKSCLEIEGGLCYTTLKLAGKEKWYEK